MWADYLFKELGEYQMSPGTILYVLMCSLQHGRHTLLVLKAAQGRTNTYERVGLVFGAEEGVDFHGNIFKDFNTFTLI